jgi:phosphoribosylformimino-5-aminoimidazole carboxamide ribotide isomerase
VGSGSGDEPQRRANRTATFEVIPAIDLRGDRCVRLLQGDYDRETSYSDDPVSVARRWQELGAPRLHVVDLDGAKDGHPVNSGTMAAICRALDIEVEVSGGLRDLAAVSAAFAYGAGRVQLGSAAVRDPELVRAACAAFPRRMVVSIDSRNGEVMTDGWLAGSGVAVLDLARRMLDLGVPRLMFTDIARDGALGGPNVEALRALVDALPVPVVASGGVAELAHLRALADAGCEGAIVGKALYEGAIDLREAIELVAC